MNHAAALPGGQSGRTSPLAPSRIGLAVAAALLMHAVVFSSTRPSARATAATAAVPVRTMTVRAIRSAAPAEVTLEATAQAGGTTAPAAPEAAPQDVSNVLLAKAVEPRPIAAPAATTAEPASSALGRSVSVATAATASASKAEATAERVVALPAAPDYLLGATLDPGPQPIGDIEPEYPSSANLQEGTVVIRVLISDTGRVDNVAVVRSAPPGLFEVATLEAFGKAQFMPARAAGVAVKSQITVEVHFLPINRGARISGRSY